MGLPDQKGGEGPLLYGGIHYIYTSVLEGRVVSGQHPTIFCCLRTSYVAHLQLTKVPPLTTTNT